MNTYTIQDVRELAQQFELAYPELAFINFNEDSIEICLKEYPEDPMRAIMEFLVGYYTLGTTKEIAQATYDFTFEIPLNNMPTYLNDTLRWKTAVASWRLKIGK
jgi:hypothetical protein